CRASRQVRGLRVQGGARRHRQGRGSQRQARSGHDGALHLSGAPHTRRRTPELFRGRLSVSTGNLVGQRPRVSSRGMKTLQAELAFQNRSTLGEGALWDVRRQRLLWVDIYQDKVFLFDPKRRANLAYSVGSNVGTVVPEGKDKLLLALRHEICSLDLETGVVTSVCRPEPMGAGMRFNDCKCDPEGRFWVGSMVEKGEPRRGALYRIDHDYRAEKLLGGLTISNGLVWHGEHFYHIDTPTQQIRRFAYDARQGSISGPAVVARIEKETGAPDGMCLDAEGMLWVALFGG